MVTSPVPLVAENGVDLGEVECLGFHHLSLLCAVRGCETVDLPGLVGCAAEQLHVVVAGIGGKHDMAAEAVVLIDPELAWSGDPGDRDVGRVNVLVIGGGLGGQELAELLDPLLVRDRGAGVERHGLGRGFQRGCFACLVPGDAQGGRCCAAGCLGLAACAEGGRRGGGSAG